MLLPLLLSSRSSGLPRHPLARCALLPGELSEETLDALVAERFVRVEDFITTEHVHGLLQDIHGLRETAASTSAMPTAGNLQWFTFGPGSVGAEMIQPVAGGNPAARAHLCELVSNLQRSLEDGVGVTFDAGWTELQYAYYPPAERREDGSRVNGGFYHKHMDSGAFHTHPGLEQGWMIKRACSFVLYLNPAWKEGDDGHLRVYESAAPDAAYMDVPPTAATLVVFKSDEVLHEVRPTNAHRVSIVGWFNRVITTKDLKQLGSDEWARPLAPDYAAPLPGYAGRVVPTAPVAEEAARTRG